jgi:flavin reductase (DIM6/NTAB) family NADH-FMN oxidoreductase RutF
LDEVAERNLVTHREITKKYRWLEGCSRYIVAMRTHLIARGDHLAFAAEVVRYGFSPSYFALEIHRVPGKPLPRHSPAATFVVTVENVKNGRCASYLGGPGRSWIAGFVEDLIAGTFGQP